MARGICGGEYLMQRVGATVSTAFGAVPMFHGNACPRCLRDIQGRAVAAEYLQRRPLRKDWNRWRGMGAEFLGRVNDVSADKS